MTDHTPTPWKLNNDSCSGSFGGVYIFSTESWAGPRDHDFANAAYIVCAANAHDALVAAARRALELLIGASALTASDVRTALRVALALAEQEASVLVFDAGEDGTEDGPAVRADAEAKEETTT